MPTPPRVALATQAALPDLYADDRLLIPALAARGVHAGAAVWDDPSVDWTTFDAVVVRSCWDYHLKHDAFLAWVARLEHAGVAVWNPPAVIRWNAEKGYLRQLDDRDVRIVPTRWIERGSAGSLHDVLHDAGWERAVVKPAISASAHETWRTSRQSATDDEARFRRMVQRGRVLVQPFMEAVVSTGEWSHVFIGGEFSHAMLKRARSGDFRVQSEHGGSAVRGDLRRRKPLCPRGRLRGGRRVRAHGARADRAPALPRRAPRRTGPVRGGARGPPPESQRRASVMNTLFGSGL
jgi:hypothetical protein